MNIRLFSVMLLVLALCACVTKRPHYDTPEIPLPATFSHQPDTIPGSGTPLKSVLPEWWRLFGSTELNRLVDQALANNPELRVANHRLVQAQARGEQARAERFPTVSLPYSASHAAPAEGIGLLPDGAERSSKRTYQASVRANWRPDLWGEVRAMYESADLLVARAGLARDDVQRAMVANVAAAYASYLSLSDRLRIAQESETLLSDLLSSVRDRMNEGDATVIDFEQQRSAVFQVRATIPQLQYQRDLIRHRLATLTGTVPQALTLQGGGLDGLSTPVVVPGVPSSLLLRRPDIRTLEATMLAADANIDVARARMLPQLDISAQYGVGGFQFSQLFNPQQLFVNGLANLSATIFDSGKRAREVAIARSVHEELTDAYAHTLYFAVREVEDALAAINSIGKRLTLQQESVTAARSAWTYSRESYGAGAIDYMVLLDTERTYHARLDEWNRIRLENFLAIVDLFQALGGGVHDHAPIPGPGKRPLAPPEADSGLVLAVQPPDPAPISLEPEKLSIGSKPGWFAEVAGVAAYSGALAARRDLYARFAEQMGEPRRVFVRQDVARANPTYRVFVAGFSNETEARAFCAVLKQQSVRCKPTSRPGGSGKWLHMGGPA